MPKQNNPSYIDKTTQQTSGEFDKEFQEVKEFPIGKIREKDWYIFVSSFLNIAQLGCKSLLRTKDLTNEKKILMVSIFFNIRHSLEIILKAFKRSLSKEMDKSDYKHDIATLFKNFETQVNKKEFNNKAKVKKDLEVLRSYVNKYFNYNFLVGYIKDNFILEDTEGTFFRYPENTTKIIPNYFTILSNITKEDIKEIRKDILGIKRILKNIKELIRGK